MELPPNTTEVPSTSASPTAGEVSAGGKEPQSNIIQAADKFREVLKVPNYTKEDLEKMGCTVQTTSGSSTDTAVSATHTVFVSIPFSAQRKILEDVKEFGFGAAEVTDHILKRALLTFGLTGNVQFKTDPVTFEFQAWSSSKIDAAPPPAADTSAPSNTSSPVSPVGETDAIIAERGKIYGDPELSHENIGLSWTGLLQQHYQSVFPYPIPAWLVELMMCAFKVHRASRVFHDDNYVDLNAYGKFAREHQGKAFQPEQAKP